MIINHWAVLVCALSNLLLGALWYSPVLFFKAWQKENKLSDEDLKRGNPLVIFGLTFLLSYIMSYNMAYFLSDPKTTLEWALLAGFLAGFGWATAIFIIIALFERRTWKYMAINGGFIVVYHTLIGFILGLWR